MTIYDLWTLVDDQYRFIPPSDPYDTEEVPGMIFFSRSDADIAANADNTNPKYRELPRVKPIRLVDAIAKHNGIDLEGVEYDRSA